MKQGQILFELFSVNSLDGTRQTEGIYSSEERATIARDEFQSSCLSGHYSYHVRKTSFEKLPQYVRTFLRSTGK